LRRRQGGCRLCRETRSTGPAFAAQDLVGRRLLIGPDEGGNFLASSSGFLWLLAVFALAVAAVMLIVFIVHTKSISRKLDSPSRDDALEQAREYDPRRMTLPVYAWLPGYDRRSCSTRFRGCSPLPRRDGLSHADRSWSRPERPREASRVSPGKSVRSGISSPPCPRFRWEATMSSAVATATPFHDPSRKHRLVKVGCWLVGLLLLALIPSPARRRCDRLAAGRLDPDQGCPNPVPGARRAAADSADLPQRGGLLRDPHLRVSGPRAALADHHRLRRRRSR